MTDTTPADAQESEAAGSEFVTVPLAGYDGSVKDVRTRPANRWRASALRALRLGDFDTFMELVLHEDDYSIYEDLDPDGDSISAFAEEAGEAAGEALGKSGGPRPSSRRTRKR